MDQEFINVYIANLTKEMGELLKIKVLLQTQLDLQQKMTSELQQKILQLESSVPDKTKKSIKKDDTF